MTLQRDELLLDLGAVRRLRDLGLRQDDPVSHWLPLTDTLSTLCPVWKRAPETEYYADSVAVFRPRTSAERQACPTVCYVLKAARWRKGEGPWSAYSGSQRAASMIQILATDLLVTPEAQKIRALVGWHAHQAKLRTRYQQCHEQTQRELEQLTATYEEQRTALVAQLAKLDQQRANCERELRTETLPADWRELVRG